MAEVKTTSPEIMYRPLVVTRLAEKTIKNPSGKCDNLMREAGVLFAPYKPGEVKSIAACWLASEMLRYGVVTDTVYRQKQKAEMVDKALGECCDAVLHIITYEENRDGKRVPKDGTGQLEALRRDFLLAWDVALAALGRKGDVNGTAPATTPSKPQPKPEPRPVDPLRDYTVWIKDMVRPFCERRSVGGKPLEDIGMRYAIDGVKLIKAGIPIHAVKDAVTMHWPTDARREVGVRGPFDFTGYGVAKYIETAIKTRTITGDGITPGCVPIMLVGPKGTGKSTHARKLAEKLDIPFGAVSMTVGTPPSAFNGKQKIGGDGGHVQSTFERIYGGGGVYLFDELDAADASLLLIVNEALANGHFHNAATGEVIERHPDFIPIAGSNTLGLGADRDYTGRERLDAASLDRWAAGRVRVNLDSALEQQLVDAIIGS